MYKVVKNNYATIPSIKLNTSKERVIIDSKKLTNVRNYTYNPKKHLPTVTKLIEQRQEPHILPLKTNKMKNLFAKKTNPEVMSSIWNYDISSNLAINNYDSTLKGHSLNKVNYNKSKIQTKDLFQRRSKSTFKIPVPRPYYHAKWKDEYEYKLPRLVLVLDFILSYRKNLSKR